MPYPVQTFNSIADWENFLNTNIVLNGNEDITGTIGNTAYNGAVTFIKKSPLNWGKAAIVSTGGDVVLSNNFLGVVVFSTVTPDSLSFGGNFYNQYVFLNMTSAAIMLGTPSVYYNMAGAPVDSIPANSAVVFFKGINDLWVGFITSGGGGGGSAQKQPNTYEVGVDADAPVAGTSTWTLPLFDNSYILLSINGGGFLPVKSTSLGGPYITKPLLSDTLTITNYQWAAGDTLTFILITP